MMNDDRYGFNPSALTFHIAYDICTHYTVYSQHRKYMNVCLFHAVNHDHSTFTQMNAYDCQKQHNLSQND